MQTRQANVQQKAQQASASLHLENADNMAAKHKQQWYVAVSFMYFCRTVWVCCSATFVPLDKPTYTRPMDEGVSFDTEQTVRKNGAPTLQTTSGSSVLVRGRGDPW